MLNHGGNSQPLIDKEEHRYKNVGAKAVILHGYDPVTDSYYPINVSANADGTYSLKAGQDYDTITVNQTSATVEAYVYTLVGVTKRTVTVTYTDATRAVIQTVVYS